MNKVITIVLNIQLPLKVEEEKKMHRICEMEVTENFYNADADNSDGLIQQRKSGQTDNQQFPTMENEDADW